MMIPVTYRNNLGTWFLFRLVDNIDYQMFYTLYLLMFSSLIYWALLWWMLKSLLMFHYGKLALFAISMTCLTMLFFSKIALQLKRLILNKNDHIHKSKFQKSIWTNKQLLILRGRAAHKILQRCFDNCT